MTMRLANFSVRYFRSLYDSTLSFKPLTLIIGPNGSGKSNLFKALRFLHVAVAGDAIEWSDYGSQLEDLVWYGEAETGRMPDQLRFSAQFGEGDQNADEYRAIFDASDSLEVFEEELRLPAEPAKGSFARYGQEIEFAGEPKIHARSLHTPSLRDYGPGFKDGRAQAIYRHIKGWRMFNIDPKSARGSSFIPSQPKEVPRLDSDASNLSAFLYALGQIRPRDLEAIEDAVRRSIELPQGILVDHDERGGSHARYRVHESPFGARSIPPESLSDGTIRLMAHLALLFADWSSSLACIEEPDAGLHPRLMHHLADGLRQAIHLQNPEGGGRQVIATTHSPEFMDCFDLMEEAEYLQVYVAERNDRGETLFTPMDNASEFAPWLERYRLGEAVRRRFI